MTAWRKIPEEVKPGEPPWDGEQILAWWFGRYVVASWVNGEWTDESLGQYHEQPTHWMRPNPPDPDQPAEWSTEDLVAEAIRQAEQAAVQREREAIIKGLRDVAGEKMPIEREFDLSDCGLDAFTKACASDALHAFADGLEKLGNVARGEKEGDGR
jgi:hypothetical protein